LLDPAGVTTGDQLGQCASPPAGLRDRVEEYLGAGFVRPDDGGERPRPVIVVGETVGESLGARRA
jgi:hypothetical protein